MTTATTGLLPAGEITARLQAAWALPGAGCRSCSSTVQRPIAGSAEDQFVPDGVQNPLWDIVRWLPAAPSWYEGARMQPEGFASSLGSVRIIEELGAYRNALATRYAWSIITPGDVTWMTGILDGRGVVEVGAGTGYWAWQLEQAGVSVAAYDPHPPAEDNNYCKHGPYTTLLSAGAEAAAEYPDRALLMVWPPYDGEHAAHALSVYKGELLIYAGESEGGCTADDTFYELLNAEWTEMSEAPQHVTYSGIHCHLTAYQRTR